MDRARSAAAGGKTRFLIGLVMLGALTALVVLVAEPVLAKRMVGTSGGERIMGTKKADRINARGGSDRVKGRAGGDRLRGSRGKDRLKGGRGKDRLWGGQGRDRLYAFDNRKDRRINGGPGRDVCTIDQADLPRLKNCDSIRVRDGGPGGGPGGGGPGDDDLRVKSASGLTCGSSLPTCQFQIEGDRADSTVGTVSGGGGADLAAGAGVAVSGEDWTATGLYGCTSDGYLQVTIGSRSVRVPITCTS